MTTPAAVDEIASEVSVEGSRTDDVAGARGDLDRQAHPRQNLRAREAP